MLPLNLTRQIVKYNVPGRYTFAEIVSRVFTSHRGIVKGKIGSYQVDLNFSDQVQRQIYFGLYDIDGINMTKRLLRPGDVFFDIGANVGYYSLIASQLVGATGQVHAFEPIPENILSIQKSISDNSIANINLNQVAVADKKSSMDIYIGDDTIGNSGWASFVKSTRRIHSLKVDVVSIDDYVRANGIDRVRLVKIDIEGAELDALKGMKNICSDVSAPNMICEINPYLLARQQIDSRAITSCLSEYGYTMYSLEGIKDGAINPYIVINDLINIFCTKKKLSSWI